jgi:HK97 family phage major capsid protein
LPYNNIIARADIQAAIPEDVAAELTRGAIQESAAMTLFRRRGLSRAQQRVPVLSVLPTAYFVTGDTGLKQTTEVNWTNKFINVEELAAIVPVPDSVVEDLDFDIWGEVRPLLEEAIGIAVDAAVFFGVNKPASWPTDVVASAVAAGNVYARGTNNAAAGGIPQDINQTIALLEADGFDPTGAVAIRSMRGRLRGAVDTTGRPLSDQVSPTEVFGIPVRYPMRGLWPTGLSAAELILGDFNEGIFGVRRDYTWKVLDQAVIQDNTGAIIYNLAQQDMVALRVTARYGWQVANVINRDQPTEASRSPFAVMRSPAV